jgi:hypothetical protein
VEAKMLKENPQSKEAFVLSRKNQKAKFTHTVCIEEEIENVNGFFLLEKEERSETIPREIFDITSECSFSKSHHFCTNLSFNPNCRTCNMSFFYSFSSPDTTRVWNDLRQNHPERICLVFFVVVVFCLLFMYSAIKKQFYGNDSCGAVENEKISIEKD